MAMHPLTFTLAPEAVVRIHDALICLAKFSDVVGWEARSDKLILTALNSSKSAYASFSLEKNAFFQSYRFVAHTTHGRPSREIEGRFTCQLYNKALLSVFKGRMVDARDRDTSVERCEVTIQDQSDKAECRLIVKMICRHGVKKTYKLTYESVEVMHALFDRNAAKNHWSIGAPVLKAFCEYFGAKTEQLDMYYEAGRATFTSYTEKIMDGKEVLRQPLQTSIALDTLDFDDFAVEEKVHIGISVKDFKAVVTHSETLKTTITALYSHPTRPLQLAYHDHGIYCEFTLMTIGEYRGASMTPAPPVSRDRSIWPPMRPESVRPSLDACREQESGAMPPPPQPVSRSFERESASQRSNRPSPPPPRASIDHNSLFIPEDDENRWDEKNYDEEEDEDQLGWNASNDNDVFATVLHKGSSSRGMSFQPKLSETEDDDTNRRVPPTQRISGIPGLFD